MGDLTRESKDYILHGMWEHVLVIASEIVNVKMANTRAGARPAVGQSNLWAKIHKQ